MRPRLTAVIALAVVFSMLGLAFASKPLYDAFCKVTGYGGTTKVATEGPSGAIDRMVTVRFDANVNGLPIRFGAEQMTLDVQVGTNALAFYKVTNISDQPVRAVANYNVTPHKMGPYFSKLECFCFTERVFQPGESVELPVVFFINPLMDEERSLRDVGTVTLSYTFYPSTEAMEASQEAAANGAVAEDGRS